MKTLQMSLPLLAALLGACATSGPTAAPASTATADTPRDCRQLDADRNDARAMQRQAEDQKGTAWKALVPFAVAGRVLSANHAIQESERRLAALNDEARQLGCRGVL